MVATETPNGEPMGFAQRRPNPRVRHPSLVWHVGTWNPIDIFAKPKAGAGNKSVATSQQARSKSVRAYVDALQERINSLATDSAIGDKVGIYDQPGDRLEPDGLISRTFDWKIFLVTVRIELEPESITVTVFLDFAYRDLEAKLAEAYDPVCSDLIRAYRELQATIDASKPPEYSFIKSEAVNETARVCFDQIWGVIDEQIVHTVKMPGRGFVDFRGIVLGDRPFVANEGEGKGHAKRIWQDAFWYEPKNKREAVLYEEDEEFWQHRLDALWPIMNAKIMRDPAPANGRALVDISRYEFTGTIFNGSALYVTALGPQPNGDITIPLYYGMYTSGMGGWAVGRLLAEIHTLGTLRLSALQNIDLLHQASDYLHEAELELQRGFNLGVEACAKRHEHGPECRHDLKEPLRGCIEKIRKRIAKADEFVAGGIAYRVGQSGYYITRFREIAAAMAAKPVADLQPYYQFVETKHGNAFKFIALLGDRYDRLSRDMRTLYQRYLSEESRILTEESRALTEESRDISAESRERNQEIAEIQQKAEYFTIVFLIPYYAGMVGAHAWWQRPDEAPQPYWVMVFSACLFWATKTRKSLVEKSPQELTPDQVAARAMKLAKSERGKALALRASGFGVFFGAAMLLWRIFGPLVNDVISALMMALRSSLC